ncbi:hypothetical protein [Pseudarcicella hirudinis]|nr:hypothetical protein [Pseudarcicella hirudinis]
MNGKEYLIKGDLAYLAQKLNVSAGHMRLVANGRRRNKRLEEALQALISKRKLDFETVKIQLN